MAEIGASADFILPAIQLLIWAGKVNSLRSELSRCPSYKKNSIREKSERRLLHETRFRGILKGVFSKILSSGTFRLQFLP